MVDAVDPDLREFQKNGGKLVGSIHFQRDPTVDGC